ncbi:transcriptional regulator [Paraburkholderia madseniana]|uniref:Transcriptional regulator n=1 Tax=Paraburkholderia madseniana TaxID=2599607 RepID=A0A6N6W9J8_9BURK|nr:CII family transcriptional regulator [Paraburkholderia madseniana]KAE8757337.1 transcriptional regulator [Paraburkholderia madseniana]
MDQLSMPAAERARKSHSEALRHISEVGQNKIAEAIGVSPPTVSRFVSEDLERACLILATVGLKVVPIDRLVVKKHMFEAIATLAYGVIDDRDMLRKLVWED